MIEQVLMHMPRPITLTERELCVLRVMERVGRRGQRRRQRRFVWCCAAAARSVLVRACLPPRPSDNGPARADACDAADRCVPRRAIPCPADRFAAARRATIPNGSKRHR